MRKYEEGVKLFESMLNNKEATISPLTNLEEISPRFAQLMMEFAFEDIFNNNRLEKRDRSLIVIALLSALSATNQLKIHIEMGRNNGLSVPEIEEAIIQIIPYSGFQNAWEALKVLNNSINND